MILLGLGTNQGDCLEQLKQAIAELNKIGDVYLCSSVWVSKSWGYESENLFLNQVVAISTLLSPHELMQATQEIEQRMGRLYKSNNGYQDRMIDIDILAYDDIIIKADELVIPHPLMCDRKFVLLPLVEITPEWVHPTNGETATCLLQMCKDVSIPTIFCN